MLITIDIAAIIELKERKGSSRQALKKYLLANYDLTANSHFDSQFNNAIKRGVSKGVFSQPKGMFIRGMRKWM